jgi:hypothetical protein
LNFAVFLKEKTMVNRKVTESEMMKMLQSGYVLLNPLVIEKIEKDVVFSSKHRADALITARIPDSGDLFNFIVEVKASSTPLVVTQAVAQAKSLSGFSEGSLPMIVVPYLSPARLEELQDQGMSGVDLCGNGFVRVPGKLYVFRSGEKNRYLESRPLNNPYKGRSANVARLLLIKQQFDSLKAIQKALADAGERMVISQVSKAVQALADDLIVTKKDGVIRLTDPSKLLDMLAAEWKNPVISSQKTLRIKNGVKSLSALSKEPILKWSVSGTSSVSKYAVFSESGPLMVAVTDMEAALKQLEWTPEPVRNFADAVLFETNEPGFFFAKNTDETGIIWANMVQSYIELSNGDSRQKEAAVDIREKIMAGFLK